ncbi:MAG: DUF1796 family putative cysteine peptidase [Chlamydiota bacterium]
MKCFSILFSIFLLAFAKSYADLDPELNNISLPTEYTPEPLFVSLGSSCEVTHQLRHLELRVAAFPLDWVLSLNNSQVIRLLEEDFLYFNDEDHLSSYTTVLLNTRYCLVFPHEGNWEAPFYSETWENFKCKSQRRVDRFRDLRSYRGKVFFIRAACPNAENPDAVYTDKDNLYITDDYSRLLYQTLKSKFPDLDFTLIVMNFFNEDAVCIRDISDDIVDMHYNPYFDINPKLDLAKRSFLELLQNFGFSESQTFRNLARLDIDQTAKP